MAVPRSVAQKVERLRREIREHEYRYYVLAQPTISDRQIDRLLDKISAPGIHSLTAEERQLLSERSRQLRGH